MDQISLIRQMITSPEQTHCGSGGSPFERKGYLLLGFICSENCVWVKMLPSMSRQRGSEDRAGAAFKKAGFQRWFADLIVLLHHSPVFLHTYDALPYVHANNMRIFPAPVGPSLPHI